MGKNPGGQTELVLENRQLLLIFFVIVALCGVFFSLGYIVGRNTFSVVAHATQAVSGGAEAGNKPSPMPPPASSSQNSPNPPEAGAGPEQAGPAADLNFYQSAEGKPPEAKLAPPESPSASSAPPSLPPSAAPSRPAAAEKPSPAEAPPGILVQVSALTRREDAQALVALLKEKKLPVLVTTGPNDTLFHVAVGPYKSDKEAEQAKKVLEEDGFRPIIKK